MIIFANTIFSQTTTQSRLLSLAPHKLDFSTLSPTLDNLIGTQSISKVHNAAYDNSDPNEAKLLFTASHRYSSPNNVIQVRDMNDNDVLGTDLIKGNFNELSIVPIFENPLESKYFVITPFQYVEIDVCKDEVSNYSVSWSLPAILEEIDNIIEIPFRSPEGSRDGRAIRLLATSKEILDENNEEMRVLFICQLYSDYGNMAARLWLFKIQDEQITFLKGFDQGDLGFSIVDDYLIGYGNESMPEAGACVPETEMELVEITDLTSETPNKFRLAFSYNNQNSNIEKSIIHVLEFDVQDFQGDRNLISIFDSKRYDVSLCSNTQNTAIIHGLEFSPNGKKLFYTHTSDCETNCYDDIKYISLEHTLPAPSNVIHNSIWSTTLVAPSTLFHSFIEMGYDNKLHIVAQDGNDLKLFNLDNPNNPSTTNWTQTIFTNETYYLGNCDAGGIIGNCDAVCSYILPDQIDGENYERDNPIAYCCETPTGGYGTIDINGDITWNDELYLTDNINITSGSKLTITGKVHFTEGTELVVQPNAKLIVDGGHLTNFCGNMWDGIRVLGNSSLSQTATNQGVAIFKNNAKVEYAINGVVAGRMSNPTLCGGIIQAESSTFLNCYNCVTIPWYSAPSPDQKKNLCYFDDCVFECTGPLPGNCFGTQSFVVLIEVHGIRFYGNTFINSYENCLVDEMSIDGPPYFCYCDGNKGIGIDALNSSFVVQRGYNSTTNPNCVNDIPYGNPNNFINLTIGINHFVDTYTPFVNDNQHQLKVLENNFSNNEIAINTVNDKKTLIYKNTFNWSWDAWKYISSDSVFGVRTKRGTSFRILHNDFLWMNDDAALQKTFIGTYAFKPNGWNNNPDMLFLTSEILGNSFKNGNPPEMSFDPNLKTRGNIITIHSGDPNPDKKQADVKIACNLYERLKYDWWIDQTNPGHQLFNQYEFINVSVDSGVENSFSTTYNTLQINNLANNFTYYWYDNSLKPIGAMCPNVNIAGYSSQQKVDCNDYPCTIYENAVEPQMVFRKSMEQIEPEKGSGNYFKVYPVPSSDYVFINYSFNEEVQYPKLKVYDINGRLLLNRGIDKKVGQILLDKNDLQAAGVYLCQIVAEGKILFSNKIIFTE